ncbi:hypothetical protein [Jatrophihabitans endophyticus]|uniref:hypothetical protein n=1 Tax=Jatrophihabitans endophyticus TaxID=1206085 RepID=UPI0019D8D7C2|nr:hypothetical protein [Jatrophihabitans endophyticus]MBE7190826.1 hypothetical protein [Jatrophihabitans endophyticus]
MAMPLFLLNEWFHPLPFIKLQMLGRRNFAYGVVGLFLFIIVSLSGTTVPLTFLEKAQGFRPLQANAVTLLVAAAQFAMLPALALLLNVRRVDGRVVSFIGMALVLASCLGSSYLTVFWLPDQFYLWQALQAVGQPMIVMPLLLMATNTVTSEDDAPFASSLINCPRAFAEAVGTWLLDLVARWRGALHSDRLVSHAGAVRWPLLQGPGVLPKHPPPLLASGQPAAPGALDAFNRAVERQVTVMTTADTYLVLGGVTVAMMAVLLLLPVRTLPPRLQLARS